jgi:LysR family transcriptional regulator, malonate utilization transcriptional regulator
MNVIDDEVTLRKLEVFLAFMRHGSLPATAQELNLSTVSVHRSLHSLEEGLRCPLFKKEGRSLVPLATAYAFAEYAQRCVRECAEGIRKTRQVAGFEDNTIVIGSGYSLTVRTMPQLVYGLKSRKPHLSVDLKLGSTRELLAKLHSDELDAAIVVMGPDEPQDDLVSLLLYHDPLMFAVPQDGPWARQETIDLRQMRHEKFVALQEDFLTVQAMQPLFDRAGFVPNIVMRAGNLFSLADLVAEGLGVGLLPARVGLFSSRVKLIALSAEFAQQQSIRLVLKRSRERHPNLLALIAECRSLPEWKAAQVAKA